MGAVQIVAHRGASSDEPEHSLAAYLAAIEQGADAIECDVRLTVDGTLVCVHDRRIDRTSTGRGVVSSKTFRELAAYDFSGTDSWRDFEDPPPDETRTKVLTLHTLLATMLESSSTVEFAIETKHPTRYGAYVERALVDMLDHFGLLRVRDASESRVRIMSFSRKAVLRTVDLAPRTPAVLLMEWVPWPYRDGRLPAGVHISGISIETLREFPAYAQKVRDKGGRVHVWTVDEPDDVQLCIDLGAEAIITNRPGPVRQLLGR